MCRHHFVLRRALLGLRYFACLKCRAMYCYSYANNRWSYVSDNRR